MRFKRFLIPFTWVLYFLFTGCENNNEEHLYGSDCDTLNMTYAKVKYIFEDNCYLCHSSTRSEKGIRTDTYDYLKAAVNTNRLLGAINHLNGFTPMPNLQPQLSDCQIDRIEAWVNAGMPL